MRTDWYYARAGKHFGPFTDAQLQQLVATAQLSQNDRLWRPGMPEWVLLSAAVQFLHDEAPSALPVLDAEGSQTVFVGLSCLALRYVVQTTGSSGGHQ